MKRIFKRLGITILVLAILYALVIQIAPGIVDKKYNQVTLKAPYQVSQDARDLYQSLDFVSDLHCDVLLWDRDIAKSHDYGHVDIPRMQESNMALQAFTIVNKTPKNMNFDHNTGDTDNITALTIAQGRSPKSWFNLSERVVSQCQSLDGFAKKSDNQFTVIHSTTEFQNFLNDRKKDKNLTAGFLGIEGAQALEGKIKNLQKVYDAGVRMIGLAHFFDNEVGGSAHGVEKYGLTDFGKEVIREMEEKHMLVDLSHASPKLIDDVLAFSKKPLIVSHTGVKGTCDNIRNLSDSQLKRIAAGNGLIGIAMFKQATCGTDMASTARAIQYTTDLIGVRHVALGSDFDGAVTAHTDVTGLPLLVEELQKLNLSDEDIKLIMGENVKRFLLENLEP